MGKRTSVTWPRPWNNWRNPPWANNPSERSAQWWEQRTLKNWRSFAQPCPRGLVCSDPFPEEVAGGGQDESASDQLLASEIDRELPASPEEQRRRRRLDLSPERGVATPE